MTTAMIERRGLGPLGWMIILGLAALVAMTLSAGMAGDVTVSPHAEARHGDSAVQAESYLRSGGAYHRDPCRDGKEMLTWYADGTWWVAIVKGNTIITMFETTLEYIATAKERDGCTDSLHLGSHDAPSMAW